MSFDWEKVDRDLTEVLAGLEGIALDRALVERFAQAIRSGSVGSHTNRISEPPRLPRDEDVDDTERFSAGEREQYTDLGRRALERGEVAVAVLNGGMATRFGGVVKGVVEVLDGMSFLEIKIAQARRLGDVPFLSMNSFATHRATLDHLEEKGLADAAFNFLQSVSLRLTPDGELFRDGDGRVCPYAPGHGDFPEALRRAGLVDELERRGVHVVILSNVDNLGADPDPLIVGYHLAHGLPLTIETARSVPQDAGGGPAWVGDRLQILESFRLPEGFALEGLPFVNTNTLLFSLDVLRAEHPLTWFYVEKNVDGRVAIQMERLVGEISGFVETAYLVVPREGQGSRYRPVKAPEDLEELRADRLLAARIRASIGRT
jgi:UTP--glucose-1-phosphate uridylyltransferase